MSGLTVTGSTPHSREGMTVQTYSRRFEGAERDRLSGPARVNRSRNLQRAVVHIGMETNPGPPEITVHHRL